MSAKSYCPNCKQPVEEGDVFCTFCGAQLPVFVQTQPAPPKKFILKCANGHEIDDPDNQYCPICGLPLNSGPVQPDQKLSRQFENNEKYWVCNRCGHNNSDEFNFCEECGNQKSMKSAGEQNVFSSDHLRPPAANDLIRKRDGKGRNGGNPIINSRQLNRPNEKDLEQKRFPKRNNKEPVREYIQMQAEDQSPKQTEEQTNAQEIPQINAPVFSYSRIVPSPIINKESPSNQS